MPFAVTFQIFILFSTLLTMKLYDSIAEQKDNLEIYLASLGTTILALTKNLQQPPISDLVLVETESDCPADYKSAPIKNFQGTYPLCYCANTTQIYLNTSCSEAQLSQGCANIESFDPQILYRWKGKVFCAKTISKHYFQLSNCETGHKRCTQNLCLLEEEECPLTGISFTKDELQKSRELSNNSWLIGLDTSLGNFSCINDKYSSKRDKHGRFYPFKQSEQGCVLSAENNSIALDKQLEQDFYKENNLTTMVETLPLFAEYTSEEEVTLQGIFRLKLNDSQAFQPVCRKLAERPSALQFPERFVDSHSTQAAYFFQIIGFVGQWLLLLNGICLMVLIMIRVTRGETKKYKIVLLVSILLQIVGMGFILSAGSFALNFFEMYEKQYSDAFIEPLMLGMARCFDSTDVNNFLELNVKNGVIGVKELEDTLRFGLVINVFISVLAGLMWYIYFFIDRYNPRRLRDVLNGLNRLFG